MNMTPEEEHAINEYKQAIAEFIKCRQETLKIIEESQAAIREAEQGLDSIPPEELDRLLPLSKSDAKPSAKLTTKIRNLIQWIL